MSDFDVLAVGERRLQVLFEDLPKRLDARIYSAMERISARLESAVRAAEPERTGALRSETVRFVRRYENAIVAGVIVAPPAGDKAAHGKAAALEYGAHRPTTVREHWAARSDFWGHYGTAQSVLIDEYTRRVNITADRFLRDPFAAEQGAIIADLAAAINEAAQES